MKKYHDTGIGDEHALYWKEYADHKGIYYAD